MTTKRFDPRFLAGYEISVALKEGTKKVRYIYTGEIPKELMDTFESVLGNAAAKISVSSDMGTKDYGNGVSASVFVTLSCGQDQATILKAINLAGEVARWAVKDQLGKSEEEFKQLMAARGL